MKASFEPIACSLPARESRDQIGEWRALAERALSTEAVAGGYAVTFGLDAAQTVEDLARREAACCGFLDIQTHRTEREIRLLVRSDNAEALPVIELLVGHGSP